MIDIRATRDKRNDRLKAQNGGKDQSQVLPKKSRFKRMGLAQPYEGGNAYRTTSFTGIAGPFVK